MEPKTIIITDANSDLGKVVATELTRQGHCVVLACRNAEQTDAAQKDAGENTVIAELDLSRRASIHAFADWVHHELGRVDVLINNAADFDLSRNEREMTSDGFERIWFTNHLAPVLLVDRLLDLLIASPQGRVLNVSAEGILLHPFLTVHLKDPMFGHRPFSASKAYFQSKLAQLMYCQWLAQQLTGTMVTANCLRVSTMRLNPKRLDEAPDWMKNMYALKGLFSVPPEKMAETFVQAALGPELKSITGRHLGHPLKEVGIPVYAKDPFCIAQVMQLTYRQLGLSPAISFEPGEAS